MIRKDVHRPSVISPDDYHFVGFQYLRVDDLGTAMFLQAERERIRRHMERTGGNYSRHEHGGNCAICGSANAIYKALFWHKPSNDYISTGLDCAEKLQCAEVATFRRNVASALEQKAGKRKAQATLEVEGLEKAWAVYTSDATNDKREESIIRDIISKLVQYGSINTAQMNFVRKLLTGIENRAAIEAKRAEESAAAAPLPVTDKRIEITGTVLSVKVPDYDRGEFGPVQMLVQHADGWKVWGSVPADLMNKIARNDRVKFSAKINPSDRDTKFGFFSRPTKAEKLSA